MDGALDAAYLVALVVALWGTGIALGAEHAASELLAPVSRAGLLGRVALVDVLLLPLLVWVLVRLLEVPDDYAVGLLLVGMASAGPLGIKAAQLAGADVPAAVSLVLALELANLVAIPFWAAVLLPDGTEVAPLDVLGTLLIMVVAPLAIGMACRRAAPRLAAHLPRPLTLGSNVGLVAVVAIVLARDADKVVDARGERVPLVAALAVAAALGLGWLAGGSSRATRASASIVTGVRATGPALAIAAGLVPRSGQRPRRRGRVRPLLGRRPARGRAGDPTARCRGVHPDCMTTTRRPSRTLEALIHQSRVNAQVGLPAVTEVRKCS